ncbi:Sec20-domain-containing protein [Dichomitus squalens]|uniref:Sec20-domain-containing protein n=2 Tax=Dichomitus squalens TaxID=114155 RepID=A0A4Q9NFP8_9APHY|nr:Sec20-domain-containing protein [Dichomitus squalens LYAD-421 SS1]EJF55892.1 Sec20-domain-containing protein [Dichomitus squalens LYAD-421 SS1]TBU26988.1 Sec20-domain-containing protein [Dichomitus squalens]TBU39909.1 Sec20-domain-containing protein [Dichomitus squalens]
MPPLPSALDEETKNLIASLERRHKDLADFQIPRLRNCTGPLTLQQQYAAELRDDLDMFARQLETLDVAVEDQRTERARRELRQVVDELQAVLTRLRKDMRAAVLASKRAIDAQQSSRREELLRSSVVKEKQTLNEKVTEDAVMKATNDVTEALQRTLGLMQGELERSVLSTQLLESSTANLKSTSTTHDVLDSLMTTSKHLITALEKSDWMDRMLIFAGLAFFVIVVLFIIKQRLVDRGLRVALFWTRFVPDFSGDEALLAAEKGEVPASLSLAASSVVSATVLTVVATASTVLLASSASSLEGEVLGSITSGVPTETVTSVHLDPSLPEGAYTTTSSSGAERTGSGTVPHDEL